MRLRQHVRLLTAGSRGRSHDPCGRRRARACATAALVLALVATAACGGGEPDGLTREQRAALAADIAAARAVPPQQEAAIGAAHERRTQDAIARCMRAAGFDYVPHLAATARTATLPGAAVGGDPVEFARRYGFGITTTIDPAGTASAGTPMTDPNTTIEESLDTNARNVYRATRDSCAATAEREIGLPRTMIDAPLLPDGSDPVDHIERRVAIDPRVEAATARWAACMAAAGVPADSPDAARADLVRRAEPLRAAAAGGPLSAAQQAELATLREREIATALADRQCAGPLAAARDAAYRDVLDDFVRNG